MSPSQALPDHIVHSHTDVVGSLLRPDWLLRARRQRATTEISDAEFAAIEDRAVDEAVAMQEEAGLAVVSDGEMRRLSFQSQLPEAVDGFGEFDLDAFLWGDWTGDDETGDRRVERPRTLGVIDKLRRRRYLCADEFSYLKGITERIPKVNLPSPSLFANFWSQEHSSHVYPSLDSFLADVVQILSEEVSELIRLGATYIQLDAPHYPLLLDANTRAFYESRGWTLDRWLSTGIELDNAVIGDFSSDITFSMHLCRGNQQSRWLVEGGYDKIARQIFQNVKVHRLLLEYDDDRSGSFEPLRLIPEDKMVVLGLVSTKTGNLESKSNLIERVREASRFFPANQLAISPQCGFASSIVGNRLSVNEQQAKLRLVADVPAEVWG